MTSVSAASNKSKEGFEMVGENVTNVSNPALAPAPSREMPAPVVAMPCPKSSTQPTALSDDTIPPVAGQGSGSGKKKKNNIAQFIQGKGRKARKAQKARQRGGKQQGPSILTGDEA
jgi:hypothetical protein